MKSISPWFQTANLLNGIRKTYSKIEASRGGSSAFQRQSGSPDQQCTAKKESTDRGHA